MGMRALVPVADGSEEIEAVCIIDHQPGGFAGARLRQRCERRDVAIHAEYAIGDHHGAPVLFAV